MEGSGVCPPRVEEATRETRATSWAAARLYRQRRPSRNFVCDLSKENLGVVASRRAHLVDLAGRPSLLGVNGETAATLGGNCTARTHLNLGARDGARAGGEGARRADGMGARSGDGGGGHGRAHRYVSNSLFEVCVRSSAGEATFNALGVVGALSGAALLQPKSECGLVGDDKAAGINLPLRADPQSDALDTHTRTPISLITHQTSWISS